MAKFILVKISPVGIISEQTSSHEKESLIAVCKIMQENYPHDQFGVTDELGNFIWPEQMANAHKETVGV